MPSKAPATLEASDGSRRRDAPGSARAAGKANRRWRKRRDEENIGSVALAEEAFHLLRTTPLANLWFYYLGTVPFVLAAFFFWADMSRSSYAARDAALGSAGLAVAYLWMKFWQGRFCQRLWEQLHPSGSQVTLSPSRMIRHFAAQAFVHAFALPVRLMSLIFLGWAIAFFQNATVLAFTQDHGRKPLRKLLRQSASCAHVRWPQNYFVLLLMAVLSFFIWMNVLGAVVLIPMAMKMFLGIETAFTLNPESTIMNTTFLFAATLLAFLMIDPFLKAIYTLRCFRHLSRHSGADLLSRLDRVEVEAESKKQRTPGNTNSATVLLSLLTAISLTSVSPVSAQETVEVEAPAATPTAETLAQSIEETLRDKDYQWRLPKQAIESATDAEKGWLATVMSDLADSFERTAKKATEGVKDFFRKLFEGKRSSRSGPAPDFAGAGAGIGNMAKVLFVVLVGGLLIWVIFLIVNQARQQAQPVSDEAGFAGPIDLESDTIVATQLPEDEWMRLAREQIAKGEHRLAIRALFLASLAHLGDRGLLRVARFKSNRDYTSELQLKARGLPELQIAFRENVGVFDRVWYGLHEIGREAIDHFTRNYERITWEKPGDTTSNDPRTPPGPLS